MEVSNLVQQGYGITGASFCLSGLLVGSHYLHCCHSCTAEAVFSYCIVVVNKHRMVWYTVPSPWHKFVLPCHCGCTTPAGKWSFYQTTTHIAAFFFIFLSDLATSYTEGSGSSFMHNDWTFSPFVCIFMMVLKLVKGIKVTGMKGKNRGREERCVRERAKKEGEIDRMVADGVRQNHWRRVVIKAKWKE